MPENVNGVPAALVMAETPTAWPTVAVAGIVAAISMNVVELVGRLNDKPVSEWAPLPSDVEIVPINVAPESELVVLSQIVKLVMSVPDTREPTVVKLIADMVVEVEPCASLKE